MRPASLDAVERLPPTPAARRARADDGDDGDGARHEPTELRDAADRSTCMIVLLSSVARATVSCRGARQPRGRRQSRSAAR